MLSALSHKTISQQEKREGGERGAERGRERETDRQTGTDRQRRTDTQTDRQSSLKEELVLGLSNVPSNAQGHLWTKTEEEGAAMGSGGGGEMVAIEGRRE